ncbi:MAG: hypothetical protein BroJett029_40460 [Alphaproteobacteria bacterium]|nr:MAG: hypothetical protein BroJett029_40460 [Alphaproteobacteria bacterium]
MDWYLLARFGHIAGFVLLGGGLAAVFLADWRGRRARDAPAFAEAARFTALFYDGLVVPGALLIAASGLWLMHELALGFFDQPWLVGMWGLFVFEFVEGNTITRLVYRRTLRQAQSALAATAAPASEFASQSLLGRFTHFLDLPLFAVIVYCGVFRPESSVHVGIGIALAIVIAATLTSAAPAPQALTLPTPLRQAPGRGSPPSPAVQERAKNTRR